MKIGWLHISRVPFRFGFLHFQELHVVVLGPALHHPAFLEVALPPICFRPITLSLSRLSFLYCSLSLPTSTPFYFSYLSDPLLPFYLKTTVKPNPQLVFAVPTPCCLSKCLPRYLSTRFIILPLHHSTPFYQSKVFDRSAQFTPQLKCI